MRGYLSLGCVVSVLLGLEYLCCCDDVIRSEKQEKWSHSLITEFLIALQGTKVSGSETNIIVLNQEHLSEELFQE